MIYGTGFGALDPNPADGEIASVLATTKSPVTATIDGVPADVVYAGAAPGLISGVTQVNVRVPQEIAPNPAASVMLTVAGHATPAGVTIAIR